MAYSNDMESRRLLEYIQVGESAIVSVANSAIDNKHNQFLVDRDLTEASAQMTTDLEAMIKLKNHLRRTNEAAVITEREIIEKFNAENPDIDGINVSEMFEQNCANLVQNSGDNVADDDNYKKLSSLLSDYCGDARQTRRRSSPIDDDLEALETETNEIPIDPFSKLPISIPVRNKKCHHVYDKEQLDLVIKSKGGLNGVRCAFIGCNNKNITMKDVMVDLKLKATIDNLRRRNND